MREGMIQPYVIKTETMDDITLTFKDVKYAQVINPQYDLFELIVRWLIDNGHPSKLSLQRAGNLIANDLLMRFNEGKGRVYD